METATEVLWGIVIVCAGLSALALALMIAAFFIGSVG